MHNFNRRVMLTSIISGFVLTATEFSFPRAANDNEPNQPRTSGACPPSVGKYRPLLDYIALCEGTASQPSEGYSTSLGFGRFLPGKVEHQLTNMTLNEILVLGAYMRRQPGNPNSSALGRYQIVGTTLKDLMMQLGLSVDALFDVPMQDRLAIQLIRRRGATIALGQEWASLRGQKLKHAIELLRQVHL